jgi:hypothetical protein
MPDDAEDYNGLPAVLSPREIRHKPAGNPGCKFYGNSAIVLRATGRLLMSGGNECALIATSYAPCAMEIAGAKPDEGACPIAEESRKGKPVAL